MVYEDAFFNFVEQDSYLKAEKVNTEANAALSPWVNSFDKDYYVNIILK
jgi:hypothetical protein